MDQTILVLVGPMYELHIVRPDHGPLYNALKRRVRVTMDKAILIFEPFAFTNYWHQIVLQIPIILRTAEAHPNVPVLTWGDPKLLRDIMASVRRRGHAPPVEVHGAIKRIVYSVKHPIVIPPSPAVATLQNLETLRSALRIPSAPSATPCCVLVRRAVDRPRFIVNFRDLYVALMTTFPRERWIVYRALPTFEDAIRLFRHAKLIVGAEGAGLANRALSPTNTTVVELRASGHPGDCHERVSQALGGKHVHILCPSLNEKDYIAAPVHKVLEVVRGAL